MQSDQRWLVCAGPTEFVTIAAALVTVVSPAAIEWERAVTRAYSRAVEMRAAGLVNVVVGDNGAAASTDAACALATLCGGFSILCTDRDGGGAGDALARGVSAAVSSEGLPRLLAARVLEAAGRMPGGLAEMAGEAGVLGIAAPSATDADAACSEDLEEPCPPCAGDLPDVSPPAMRTTGRFPRVGVVEELAQRGGAAIAADAGRTTSSFDEPGAVKLWGGGDAAPASQNTAGGPAVAQPAGAVVAPSAMPGAALPMPTEPVVHRPLLDLPQLDCRVAGEDEAVPTICFASARGGVGKSALAVMCALALARGGLSVALVDLDFQFGTCLGYLGADETDGLFDAGEFPERIRVDARSLARCRTTPERGLAAYEFCKAPEQSEVLGRCAGELLKAARAGADIAVVDVASGVGEAAAQVFDLVDRCLLVIDQRSFSLESLAAQQSLCARLGMARAKLVTVVNRCDPRHRDEGFLERVRFSSQTSQIAKVVDGGDEVTQLLSIGSAGELLATRNRFALSTSDLARSLAGDLGCGMGPATPPILAEGAVAPLAVASPEHRRLLRRRKGPKEEAMVECPF